MKLKKICSILIVLVLISCSDSKIMPNFINKVSGRYLFNSDEVIEVYSQDNILFLKWRGSSSIKPIMVDEKTFFVKEMNEKIQFLNNPSNGKDYIVFVPKDESESINYKIRKLANDEKIPNEYLKDNEYEKALEAYLQIQKTDSLDNSIDENSFNAKGYKELRHKNYVYALNIFKINTELYPKSANVYDSYADANKQFGDTLTAIKYYKKSLEIDSGNRRAKRFIKKYDKK